MLNEYIIYVYVHEVSPRAARCYPDDSVPNRLAVTPAIFIVMASPDRFTRGTVARPTECDVLCGTEIYGKMIRIYWHDTVHAHICKECRTYAWIWLVDGRLTLVKICILSCRGSCLRMCGTKFDTFSENSTTEDVLRSYRKIKFWVKRPKIEPWLLLFVCLIGFWF